MMAAVCSICLYLIVFTNANEHLELYDNWRVTSASLPTPPAAVGYAENTNTLYFLGGINSYNAQQLASYNTISESVEDLGSTTLQYAVYVGAQSYAQIGSVLYIADSYGDNIHTFNVDTQVMVTDHISIPGLTARSCFANIADRYLAILSETGEVHLYDTSDGWWMTPEYTPTDTNKGRFDASCIYFKDYLYIISGQTVFGAVYDDMEYINVSSVINGNDESWTSKTLSQSVYDSRLIAVHDKDVILIIGGSDSVSVFDTVFVLDTTSMEVVTGGYMAKKGYSQCVVMIGDIIFSFGGYTGTFDSNPWTGVQLNELYPASIQTTNSSKDDRDKGGGGRGDLGGSLDGSNGMVICAIIAVVVLLILIVVGVVCCKRKKKGTVVQQFDENVDGGAF